MEELNKVLKLAVEDVASQANAEDSDDDMYGQTLEIGSVVDVFFERGGVIPGWYPAKVIFSLEEMVKVQTTFDNN